MQHWLTVEMRSETNAWKEPTRPLTLTKMDNGQWAVELRNGCVQVSSVIRSLQWRCLTANATKKLALFQWQMQWSKCKKQPYNKEKHVPTFYINTYYFSGFISLLDGLHEYLHVVSLLCYSWIRHLLWIPYLLQIKNLCIIWIYHKMVSPQKEAWLMFEKRK